MSTPHIQASSKKNEIAKIVVMCGDPLRAKKFALDFLVNPTLVNQTRGMLAYTGKNKAGTNITVMGHGMGLDSIGIYSYELYKFYDVETIIRFGSCGSYSKDIKLFDLYIAKQAWTGSNYGDGFGLKNIDTVDATPQLFDKAMKISKKLPLSNKVFYGKVNSSPWFYKTTEIDNPTEMIQKGIEVVEMEAYALYAIAKSLNKNALTILTVSDNLVTKEETNILQRQEGFTNMFNLVNSLVNEI